MRSREHTSSVHCVCYIKENFLSLHPRCLASSFPSCPPAPERAPQPSVPCTLHPEQQACLCVRPAAPLVSLSPVRKPRCYRVAFRPEATLLLQDARQQGPPQPSQPTSVLASRAPGPNQGVLVAVPETLGQPPARAASLVRPQSRRAAARVCPWPRRTAAQSACGGPRLSPDCCSGLPPAGGGGRY